VAVPKPNEEFLRKISALNVLFAVSSIGLLLVMVWMVYDDYSRGWKGYQRAFQRLQAERTRAEIEAAQKALDAQELDRLRKELEAAQAEAARRDRERREIDDRLRQLQALAYKDDLAYRTTKSIYDAKKFEYEEAVHLGATAAARVEKEMKGLETELESLRVKNLEHQKAIEEAGRRLAGLTGGIDAAQKTIADLTAGVDRLETRLETVAPSGLMRVAIELLNAPLLDFIAPTLKIQQVVLERVPIDINFTQIPRADRCQTCHLGADRAGFEEAPQPFRTHPRLDRFAGGTSPHPVDRFGCTPCHAGRDRAIDFNLANHTPDGADQKEAWERDHGWERDHYWDFPMLARSRTEAGCLKCHQGVVAVPEAPRLNRGLALVERVGCYGCHKMRGFNERPKVGPPLTRITAKTTPEWMARWITDPKAFRPSTRMPRFFGLPNNQGPGDAEREQAEVLGIVAYLTSKAERLADPPLPGRGDPRRGERLVHTVGCMGCHAIEKVEAAPDILQARDRQQTPDPVAFERRFGPDLSRIGSKVRAEWLFQWVQDPHAYNPATRMPSLRLTRQEALDVTAFLMTLRDDTPAAARARAPAPQPEARDRTLLLYLTQRMTPGDARARLESLADRERDILLGERTIARYGCFGCHLIPGFETTPAIGVDLSEEGSKHASLLYFGYVPIEHTTPSWLYQKLKDPRSFDQGKVAEFYDRLRMPQFDFTDEEAAAVTTVLQGLTKERVPLESTRRLSARDEAVEAGRRVIRDYNCQGCHVYEGGGGAIRESIIRNLMAEGRSQEEAELLAPSFAPPILDGEGDKVQPDWLFGFLKDPTPIRPWLDVRMPTFGFTDGEADALVHHFAAKDQRTFPFETFPHEPPRGATLQAALEMFGRDVFNCWSCHQQGARKPEGPPEGWAPDLALAHERLNPDWIARWIADPQKMMPGTKMPTFYPPDDPQSGAPPDILGGDPKRQIEVLRDYIFTLGRRRGGTMSAHP
jgi:cbb3-type cytochrome oxidase cytochrome c subunit